MLAGGGALDDQKDLRGNRAGAELRAVPVTAASSAARASWPAWGPDLRAAEAAIMARATRRLGCPTHESGSDGVGH
jgi:hypothetical protein